MGGETTSDSKKLVDILNSVTGDKIGEPVELTDDELEILHNNADKDAGGFVRWNSETIGIIRKILKGRIGIRVEEGKTFFDYYKIMISAENAISLTRQEYNMVWSPNLVQLGKYDSYALFINIEGIIEGTETPNLD